MDAKKVFKNDAQIERWIRVARAAYTLGMMQIGK
jgi:hypothetical protein